MEVSQIYDWFNTAFDILVHVSFLTSIYVAKTDTPEDDKLYGKFYKVLETLSVVTNKTKMLPPKPNEVVNG